MSFATTNLPAVSVSAYSGANPQPACHCDPEHCSWQTSFSMVFLYFYCPLQRTNEALAHLHPEKVIRSTHGLAKQQLQALLTHV